MRNSMVLTSALAVGAAAMPHLDRRKIVTEVVTNIQTVVVFQTVTRSRSTPVANQPSVVTTGASASGPSGIVAPIGTDVSSTMTGSLSTPVSIPSILVSTSSGSAIVTPTLSVPPVIVSSLSNSGIVAPIGTDLTSSSLTSASSVPLVGNSPSSTAVSVPPIVVSSSGSASVSPIGIATSSIASAAASPLQSSSSAAAPVSSQAASSTVVATPTPTGPADGSTHITGPSQAYLVGGIDYENAILYHHNAARANHRAAPLVWNDTCAQNAAYTANTCEFAHSLPPGVSNGQNLFTVSGTVFNVTAGITESWYKAEFAYMNPNYWGVASLSNDVFEHVGHLTQLLWQTTTSVGCVSVDCGSRMTVGGVSTDLNKYTVCNYYPPGNIAGTYNTGVLPPLSTTNLGSWSD